MTGESARHVKLVEHLAEFIQGQHKDSYSLVLFIDLPSAEPNRPSRIDGYVPDIFAVDVPETFRIIGEAKTQADCETARSLLQIRAFLRHLSFFPNGHFYLSVPLYYRPRAEQIVAEAKQEVGALGVLAHIITAV